MKPLPIVNGEQNESEDCEDDCDDYDADWDRAQAYADYTRELDE